MPAVSGSTTQLRSSVSTASDLAGVPDDAFAEGDLAAVTALWPNSTFRLRRTALVGAPDNVTTIDTFSGNGYWEVFGVSGGVLVFATVTALAAYNDASLTNGALVYVESVRSYFSKLIEADPTTSDGITNVRNPSDTASWYRSPVPSPSWKAQASWYVSNTGSDEALGDAPGTALANFAEFVRRLPVLNQDTTVTILDDTTEALIGQFSVDAGVEGIQLIIEGDPEILVASTDITAYAAPNPDSGTNLPGTLQATGIDWNTVNPVDGKSFVQVIAGPRLGVTAPVLYSIGGVTGYTPDWTLEGQGFVQPIVGDLIRVTRARTAPVLRLAAEGLLVVVRNLHLTETQSINRIDASPFAVIGGTPATTRMVNCRIDGVFDAATTFFTSLEACILDTDAGTFSITGTGGQVSLTGSGVDGDLSLSTGVVTTFNGVIVMIGSVSVRSESSDALSAAPQIIVGSQGLGIFGVAITTTGLTLSNAIARINGPLYGKDHLRGLFLSQGAFASVKSTLAVGTQLSLTGTTEIALSSPPGLVAPNVVRTIAGVPGATAAMNSWATWNGANFNRIAVNYADMTRMCGTV